MKMCSVLSKVGQPWHYFLQRVLVPVVHYHKAKARVRRRLQNVRHGRIADHRLRRVQNARKHLPLLF